MIGYDTVAILLTLAGVYVGIPSFVVCMIVAGIPAIIVGLGIMPLLVLLIFAILTTSDNPHVKSENLRRCRDLLLLAVLGFLPAISLPVVICIYVPSILR